MRPGFASAFWGIVGLAMGLAGEVQGRRLASTACPFIPPFGNPINVVNVALARLAVTLKPNSEDEIRVMYVNMQSFEFPVFRYVFKIIQKNGAKNRLLYMGLLSTLPSFDDLNNPDATHSVIRIVMTGDLLDIQRVLGDFSMSKFDELNCGNVRNDFGEYTSTHSIGFDSAAAGNTDINDLSNWLTKVGTDQNGGQMPTTVDFQGVLALMKAYQNGRSNSTSLPTMKIQTAAASSSSTTFVNGQSSTLPNVMYSLPFSQVLRGDGSSIIRGFTVNPNTLRSLKREQKPHHSHRPPESHHKQTRLPRSERMKFKQSTRASRRHRLRSRRAPLLNTSKKS